MRRVRSQISFKIGVDEYDIASVTCCKSSCNFGFFTAHCISVGVGILLSLIAGFITCWSIHDMHVI